MSDSDWAITLKSGSVIGPFDSMQEAYTECEKRGLSMKYTNIKPISSPEKYWGDSSE